jgi:hypothetical protein
MTNPSEHYIPNELYNEWKLNPLLHSFQFLIKQQSSCKIQPRKQIFAWEISKEKKRESFLRQIQKIKLVGTIVVAGAVLP